MKPQRSSAGDFRRLAAGVIRLFRTINRARGGAQIHICSFSCHLTAPCRASQDGNNRDSEANEPGNECAAAQV